MRGVILGVVTGIFLVAGFAAGVRGEVNSAAKGSFRSEQELVLPA